MTGVPYIRLFGDDWLSGTASLSLEERGALITIVTLTASTGEPPAYDLERLARRLGCTKSKAKKVIGALQELGKISIVDGVVFNGRAVKETKNSQEKSQKQTENANARWAKKDKKPNENNGGMDAVVMPRQCQPEPEPEPDNTSLNRDVCKKPNPPPKTRRKPMATIPCNWQPNPPAKITAEKLDKLTLEEQEDELQKFRDHHTAKQTKSADFNANWRTWVSNAVKWKAQRKPAFNGHRTAESDARREQQAQRSRIAKELDGRIVGRESSAF